ncbi:asparagine synthase-related protein [Vibrio chagasii]|nr:asparagine synthase-related protein [Vibrio chagasii]
MRAQWPQLHSFAVGLEGAPDLIAAREWQTRLVPYTTDDIHHSRRSGCNPLMLSTIETYDVTTIRASTPMYLLARKDQSNGYQNGTVW